jgi:hypothetical protein
MTNPTHSAACTRCKNQKVKCEMKSESDPCRRCLNAGQPCIIPGKKKRRAPPSVLIVILFSPCIQAFLVLFSNRKREHLLNQIREQASHIQELMGHIQKLMAQLEVRKGPTHRSSGSSATDLDPSSPIPSSSSSYDLSDGHSARSPTVSPDVQDWIAKAKESIEAFGEFVGMGGAAIAKSLLVDEDLEDEESSEEDDHSEDEDGVIVQRPKETDHDEYAIAVEDSDGEEAPGSTDWNDVGSSKSGNRRSSGSSMGGGPTGTAPSTPHVKKKELGGAAKKLSVIPPKTSPWGLMANLNRKNNLSRKGSEENSDAEGDVGVARGDFFSPSEFTPSDKIFISASDCCWPSRCYS